MNKKEMRLFGAAGLIFISRVLFISSLLLFLDFILGNYEGIAKPIIAFSIGSIVGVVGFHLTGASKLAWLQLPHQTSALIGVGIIFGSVRSMYNGTAIALTYVLLLLGIFFIISWWYCAKHNVYKA